MRKKFITFFMHKTYALNANEVKEIIPFPRTITTPPGLPAYLKGIFRLNGETVIIVNTQILYLASGDPDKDSTHLLIIKKNKLLFALMTNSTEIFISVDQGIRVDLVEINNDDVAETVLHRSQEGNTKVLNILDLDLIAKRISRNFVKEPM